MIKLILMMLLTGISVGATGQAGQTTLTYTDSSRDRRLITEVWYPAVATPGASFHAEKPLVVSPPTVRDATPREGKKYPLVLISHGTGGDRLSMVWLTAALAEKGYIVAAVNHWGNTWDNIIPDGFIRMWERPLDIQYVLTQLLRDKVYGKLIDAEKISAVGFSLGGYTVISLAGGKMNFDRLSAFTNTARGQREATIPEFPDLLSYLGKSDYKTDYEKAANALADPRIRCVVAMAPAIGQGFDGEGLKSVDRPVLIVAAPADSIAPIATNAQYYHNLIAGDQYELLEESVGHYIFLNQCTPEGEKVLPAIICQDDPSVDRARIHAHIIELVHRFLQRSLKL